MKRHAFVFRYLLMKEDGMTHEMSPIGIFAQLAVRIDASCSNLVIGEAKKQMGDIAGRQIDWPLHASPQIGGASAAYQPPPARTACGVQGLLGDDA